MISSHLAKIQDTIQQVCSKCGRNPQDITLVGVTKYAQAAQIQEAIEAGLTHVGENRVQDASLKFEQVPSIDKVSRHMIGHLQTNKVRSAVELFTLIESVDSIKVAKEIQKHAERLDRTVEILLQINVAGEEQKYGLDPNDTKDLLEYLLSDCDRLNLNGLMTIAPMTDDERVLRNCFAGLRTMAEHWEKEYASESQLNFKELSMGMSADYPVAIEEGATMVRIGRAIFYGS